MLSNKRINILFQSDEKFAFMVGVALTSLLENASKHCFYDIYIFGLDYSDDTKGKFYSLKDKYSEINYNLKLIDASPFERIIKDLGLPDHRGSYVTYFKLFLGRFFEGTDVDRIIHIGADCLITGNLSELADFDFEDAPFAMNWTERIPERYYPHKGGRTCIAEMVFFNLPVWREMRCEERIVRHIKEIGNIYGSADQGLLNTEFEGEFVQLPLKYNAYSFVLHFSEKNWFRYHNAPILTKEEIVEAMQHPEIIHYARSFLCRPCEEGERFFPEDSKRWWHYCNISPWRGMQPIKNQPKYGIKEKIFRWLYAYFPQAISDVLYIYSRRLFALLVHIKCYPKKNSKIGKI